MLRRDKTINRILPYRLCHLPCVEYDKRSRDCPRRRLTMSAVISKGAMVHEIIKIYISLLSSFRSWYVICRARQIGRFHLPHTKPDGGDGVGRAEVRKADERDIGHDIYALRAYYALSLCCCELFTPSRTHNSNNAPAFPRQRHPYRLCA